MQFIPNHVQDRNFLCAVKCCEHELDSWTSVCVSVCLCVCVSVCRCGRHRLGNRSLSVCVCVLQTRRRPVILCLIFEYSTATEYPNVSMGAITITVQEWWSMFHMCMETWHEPKWRWSAAETLSAHILLTTSWMELRWWERVISQPLHSREEQLVCPSGPLLRQHVKYLIWLNIHEGAWRRGFHWQHRGGLYRKGGAPDMHRPILDLTLATHRPILDLTLATHRPILDLTLPIPHPSVVLLNHFFLWKTQLFPLYGLCASNWFMSANFSNYLKTNKRNVTHCKITFFPPGMNGVFKRLCLVALKCRWPQRASSV